MSSKVVNETNTPFTSNTIFPIALQFCR